MRDIVKAQDHLRASPALLQVAEIGDAQLAMRIVFFIHDLDAFADIFEADGLVPGPGRSFGQFRLPDTDPVVFDDAGDAGAFLAEPDG